MATTEHGAFARGGGGWRGNSFGGGTHMSRAGALIYVDRTGRLKRINDAPGARSGCIPGRGRACRTRFPAQGRVPVFAHIKNAVMDSECSTWACPPETSCCTTLITEVTQVTTWEDHKLNDDQLPWEQWRKLSSSPTHRKYENLRRRETRAPNSTSNPRLSRWPMRSARRRRSRCSSARCGSARPPSPSSDPREFVQTSILSDARYMELGRLSRRSLGG